MVYLVGKRGWQMDARELIETIFPGREYGTRVPADVKGSAKIGDLEVHYMTSQDARAWREDMTGKRSGRMVMRAFTECPHCGKITAASRINQHMKAHTGRREGY